MEGAAAAVTYKYNNNMIKILIWYNDYLVLRNKDNYDIVIPTILNTDWEYLYLIKIDLSKI